MTTKKLPEFTVAGIKVNTEALIPALRRGIKGYALVGRVWGAIREQGGFVPQGDLYSPTERWLCRAIEEDVVVSSMEGGYYWGTRTYRILWG